MKIILLVLPSSPRPLLPSFSHNSGPCRGWLRRLIIQKGTEGLDDDDLFLLRGPDANLLYHVLPNTRGTSLILRSDWMTFFVVDQ